MDTLNKFSSASESSLYFSSNATNNLRNDIVHIMQIQHKTTIDKFLRIHNINFWNDPINAKKLILKIKLKLAGWKVNTLS